MVNYKSNAEEENSRECVGGGQGVQPSDVLESKRGYNDARSDLLKPKQTYAIQSGGSITAHNLNTQINNINNSNFGNSGIGSSGPYLFMLKDSIEPFTGRVDILKRMHKAIQANQQKLKPTVLSQVLPIVGGEAVGKTEVTRKYANDRKDFYRHILWINAETHDKAKSCFLQVASQIDVLVSFGGKQKQLDFILDEIYDKLCRERCLIVFDSANSMEGNEGIQPFLPKTIKPNWKHPAILITSRNLNWGNVPAIPMDHWKQQRDRSTVPSSNPAMPRPSRKTNREQGITNPRLIILVVVGLVALISGLAFLIYYLHMKHQREIQEAERERQEAAKNKKFFRDLITYIFGASSALSFWVGWIIANVTSTIYGGFFLVAMFLVHQHH